MGTVQDTMRVIVPNLTEDYIAAQVTVLRIQRKVETLREKGNYKSMGKVINDELLKATMARNKALATLQSHLDEIAKEKS